MNNNFRDICCLLIVMLVVGFYGSLQAIEISTSGIELEIDTYQAKGHRSLMWDDDVYRGFEEYYSNNFDKALIFLENAYNSGCRDGLVLYRLAVCYASMDKCEKAVFYGKQAVHRLQDKYPEHHYNQSIYQLVGDCTKDGDKAIETYLKGLGKDRSDVSARLNMSYKLIDAGKLDEAEKEINIVLKEYSHVTAPYGHGVAYNGLGQIYYKRAEFEQAEDYFKKALDYRNSGVDAWWLAMSYEGLRDYSRAAKYWKLAAELYGDNTEWGRKAMERYDIISHY